MSDRELADAPAPVDLGEIKRLLSEFIDARATRRAHPTMNTRCNEQEASERLLNSIAQHGPALIAEVEAGREALREIQPHLAPWRSALLAVQAMCPHPTCDSDDAGYWGHEIAALDRAATSVAGALGAQP